MLSTPNSGSVAFLRIQQCFPGTWPSWDLQEKQNYHLNLFVTEKWPLPLTFSLISASASSSGAVTTVTERIKKKSVKMFGKTAPSTVAKRTMLLWYHNLPAHLAQDFESEINHGSGEGFLSSASPPLPSPLPFPSHFCFSFSFSLLFPSSLLLFLLLSLSF